MSIQSDQGDRTSIVDYNFPPQTPGGSLVTGENTIILRPVPAGVNGRDANHYLYISGGTGAAEAVLITGGTGTSGQTSGEIKVKCANAHSGAWTISSASAGFKEADIAAGAPSTLFVPDGAYTWYAPLVLRPGNGIAGASSGGCQITLAYGAGHGVTVSAGNTVIEVAHLTFRAAVRVFNGFFYVNCFKTSANVHDVFFYGGWGHILFDNCPTSFARVINMTAAKRGIQIGGNAGSSGVVISDIISTTAEKNANAFFLRNGLADISNCALQDSATEGGGSQIVVAPLVNEGFGESTLTNITCDGGMGASLRFITPPGSGCFGWTISNCQFTGGNHPDRTAIATSPQCCNMQFSNIQIRGVGSATNSPILIIGGSAISFDQLTLGDLTRPNTTAIQIGVGATAVTRFSLTSSVVGYASSGAPDANVDFALDFRAVNHTDMNISGNSLFGKVATVVNPPTAFVRWVVASNLGFTDAGAAAASAVALAFPLMDNGGTLTLTGLTGVRSVSGLRKGQTGYLFTAAAVSFAAGPTIGASYTSPAGGISAWWFDGVKLWLK